MTDNFNNACIVDNFSIISKFQKGLFFQPFCCRNHGINHGSMIPILNLIDPNPNILLKCLKCNFIIIVDKNILDAVHLTLKYLKHGEL